MKLKEMQLKYNMVATAEIYCQRPDDPYFNKFSPQVLEGIKRLAKALQKVKDKGKIK